MSIFAPVRGGKKDIMKEFATVLAATSAPEILIILAVILIAIVIGIVIVIIATGYVKAPTDQVVIISGMQKEPKLIL